MPKRLGPVLGSALAILLAGALHAQWKQSYAPIISYDTTSGMQYGAAAFLEDEQHYAEAMAIASEYGGFLGILELRQRLARGLRLEIRQTCSNFFDNYYGEGNQNHLTDRKRLDQRSYTGRVYLLASEGVLEAGPFVEWRWRDPTGVDGDPLLTLFPGETTAVSGLLLRADGRDNRIDTRRGGFGELKAWLHPASEEGSPAFGQAQAEARAFWTLGGRLTLGARLDGGWTWGPATYLYRFKQGGNWVLRGHGFNRFRGEREISGSVEARFPLWGWLSGAVFADSGEVGDELRGRFRSSAGGGLRLALPPDGLMKARLDYGKGSDEDGVLLEFGQAF